MPTDHDIPKLIINKVPTKAQYDQMVKNADELYLIPDDSQGLPDQTGQSGKYLKTDGTDASWESVPAGTVTSVRVQAGTGLASSQSTAQSTTLNTTISIASGYKLPTTTEWGNKQDAISDLSTIRDGASAGATAVQPGDLSTVATSGSYNDLINKPTIPAAQVNSDWNATSGVAQILNKPTIPTVGNAEIEIQKNGTKVDSFTANQSGNKKTINITVPTNNNELTNGAGYITSSDIPTNVSAFTNDAGYLTSHQNIKTLKTDNTTGQTASSGEALTGSGTINLHKVAKTGSYNDLLNKPTIPTIIDTYSATSSDGMSGKAVASAISNKADKATSLSGYGITDSYTKTEVDGMISSVYKPAGSVAFASLPTLAAGVLGNVYNVTDAFTTTNDFVEGSGKSYPAGTNVVVVNTGTSSSPTYKFDVLSGFVDLSGYVPTSRTINGKALTGNISLSASDVGALPDSTTIPQGTVTSVRVQAGTGLSSSVSTAQSTSLDTTISIASGYKLPTTTEWGNKQDALATQTAYTSKGSATKVPQITTNTLGQVTGITEVNITQPTVNNSTITIQKNGTNVDSFTTNAASGKNINITLAKGDVGLGNVDNTADLDKPISTATQTALDTKQNTISDLGYIRNQVAKIDDKISGIDITDSGDSLPSAAGYSVNDTFLNKTDKKLYTVETPAWQLGPNVSSSSSITVDLTNGVATGFTTISNPGGTSYTNMLNSYGKDVGNSPIYFHFKTGSTIPTYGYIIAFSTTVIYYQQYLGVSAISDSKLQINCFTYYNGNSTNRFNHQLFDTSLEPNTEYYIYITYNGSEYISTLSSTGYNVNILETSTIEESTTQYGSSIYYGGFLPRWPTYNGMTVYLADSMGEFVVPDGALTWDSGVSLEDNTQYNDTTNTKTLYYNNNILYDSGDSLPSQSGQSGKFLTTNGTIASWGSVDALPSQSGQSGKYLTTDGSSASWATVQAGPKFLSFTNVTASSWVNNSTYTDYGYKCVLTCTGTTSSDYAQVIFGPDQANSGNYANVCLTGTDSVTIYSKVNTSISIPTIIVMGA